MSWLLFLCVYIKTYRKGKTMYAIYTFPVVKVKESKDGILSVKEAVVSFQGKVSGVALSFSAFGAMKETIKSYNLKAGDCLTITAEAKVYKNRNDKQDESYNIISCYPVKGCDKTIWPTVFFPSLKVLSIKEGEASTGKYYRLFASEMNTIHGITPCRNLVAWTGGAADYIERMKLKKGSEISVACQAKYSLGPEGKRIDFTLLSFEYLRKSSPLMGKTKEETEVPAEEIKKEEHTEEPAFESIAETVSATPEEKKPVSIEFNVNDFEEMFL